MGEEKKQMEVIEAPEPEAQPDGDIQFAGVYTFSRPVTFEGKIYNEVNYDFDALRATDVMSAKREANRIRGTNSREPLMVDDVLHAVLFARSADLPAGFVLEMSAGDYAAWASVGQLFFGNAASSLIR